MSILKTGDKVGLVACSNALLYEERQEIETLIKMLQQMGLTAVLEENIFSDSAFGASPYERAQTINRLYVDTTVKAVFDLSGGDLANETLPYLDYELIGKQTKPFWGYSDLSTVINAIYTKTGKPSCLYQIRNLLSCDWQPQAFRNSLLGEGKQLFEIDWRFIQGERIAGQLVGGNLRCFLKLAGTPYFPDVRGKVLFLESLSGSAAKTATYFMQLKQMGVFDEISGLLLGTFTALEQAGEKPDAAQLACRIVNRPDMPIAKTQQVGHGADAKCLVIGKEVCIEKEAGKETARSQITL